MWYMTLTGNTDLTASKYVPEYMFVPLSAELVTMLKTAAMTAFNK